MKVLIKKSVPQGEITVPPSKSIAHRMLINASMCDTPVKIHNLPKCDDISATVECLKALGNEFVFDNGTCTVFPKKSNAKKRILNCRESGSTLRFLIPITLLDGIETTFIGAERLFQRPLGEFSRIAKEKCFLWQENKTSLICSGKLDPADYFVKGNVSSQFVSGLLLALASVKGKSSIIITTEIESEPYIDLTVDSLKKFGIKVEKKENVITVFGGKRITPGEVYIEGDHSNGAFFGAMNFMGGAVNIKNLNENSIQGDKVWQELFAKFKNDTPEISVRNCPDLAPILMVLGAYGNGCTLLDTRRLEDKECNRALAMKEELEKFGIKVIVDKNSITVNKGNIHTPKCTLFGHNDHRIVMALAILCAFYGGEIDGAEAVNKSFPEFWNLFNKLKIEINTVI